MIERNCTFFYVAWYYLPKAALYVDEQRNICCGTLPRTCVQTHTRTRMFLLAHSCHSVTEMGLGAKRHTLAPNSHGGRHSGRFTWISKTCSLDTLQNRKWIQCLSWNRLSPTAVHTHVQRERKWQIPQRTAISSAASLHVITIKLNHGHLIGQHPLKSRL